MVGIDIDATFSVSDELDLYLRRLLEDGSAPLGEYEFADATPEELGLVVVGDLVQLPQDVERLHAPLIEGALSGRAKDWLVDLEVALAIDSTNVRMVELAQSESVAGHVLLAELQTAGRGRRGRRWFSPFARNLAVTLGVGLSSQPEVFGSISLVVGLAVADLLQSLGVRDVSLKWPNDVLIGGAKVCGILIEVVKRADLYEGVIGIGINFEVAEGLRRTIEQPVTDLKEQGIEVGRNQLAGDLISMIVRYVDEFDRRGFAPMRAAYEAIQAYRGQTCYVILGAERIEGIVLGVANDGQLCLRCAEGERLFNGGEVSLRGT